MAVRHKIHVFSGGRLRHAHEQLLWYVDCRCGWQPGTRGSNGYYGREHWDTALALGIVHLKEERDAHLAQ